MLTIEVNGKKITLNEIQSEALEKMRLFLKSKYEYFFCLSGSAGTGKTTICKEAIKNTFRCVVTAPTHKAKKVIALMTGRESSTIHALIGLKPEASLEDFSQVNILFYLDPRAKEKIADYDLVIIDEASMINSSLLEMVMEKAKINRTKIIFMGDPMQLPPVKEKEAPVFTKEGIIQFKLVKVERQKDGNPILNLYANILSNIESTKDLYIKESEFVADTREGYQFLKFEEFKEQIQKHFQEDPIENKVIAWQNKRVVRWNKFIRYLILGEGKTIEEFQNYPLQVGEIIVSYKTVRNPNQFTEILSQNSSEYRVLDIRQGCKTAKMWDNVEYNILGSHVIIQDLDSEAEKKIFIVDKASYGDFYRLEKDKSEHAKRQKDASSRKFAWAMYFQFRDEFFLLGDIENELGEVLVKKDFDFAYAITVHKSQGSTYENVFVDEADLDCNSEAGERNRLKYVAFSRPRKAAYILCK